MIALCPHGTEVGFLCLSLLSLTGCITSCNVNAAFVSEVIRTEWKLWAATVLAAGSVPSLRWQEIRAWYPHWERTIETGAWLCSLLKCPILHREHFVYAPIYMSPFHVWGKTARKQSEVKKESFIMQPERIWWLYFASSWLKQMLTVVSHSSAQLKRAEHWHHGLAHWSYLMRVFPEWGAARAV